MGWANRITVARGLLTFGVWALVAGAGGGPPQGWWWAFGGFVLTAVTDVLDGAVARRLGEVSVFGRIADPLVDKLLVLGTMTVLLPIAGMTDALPAWVVLVVLVRELLVTALRAAVESGGASFQAQFWGKAKMVVQCAAVGATLLFGAGVGLVAARPEALGGRPVAVLFAWAAAAVTAISAVDYVRRAVALLSRR